MLCDEFDPERRAVINPDETHGPIEGFPEICLGIFSKPIVDHLVEKYRGMEITHVNFCTGTVPVYRVEAGGTPAVLFLPHVGGPAAVDFIENMIPHGGKYFVFCGAAGVLDPRIAHGKLLLPTAAIRDEGTSYHYLPPSGEVALDPASVDACRQALTALGLPFVEGKTWTTDAFYRETRAKLRRRREQGCVSVDMECASLAAAAQFRGVPFAQFFYATDTLDEDAWDNGILNLKGTGLEDICFQAALETGRRMAESGLFKQSSLT